MKTSILFLTCCLWITTTEAQKINEGHLKFIVDYSSSNPELESQLAVLKGSSSTIYFSPKFSRTEISVSNVSTTTIINDKAKNKSVLFMDGLMGGMKFAVADLEALAGNKDSLKAKADNIAIEKTNETKEILGYVCTKYHVIMEDGSVNEFWCTPELSHIPQNSTNNYDISSKLDGFPLEYSLNTSSMQVKFTANELTEGIDKSAKKRLFNMKIPKDYKVLNKEEIQALGGLNLGGI